MYRSLIRNMPKAPNYMQRRSTSTSIEATHHRRIDGTGKLIFGTRKHNTDFLFTVDAQARASLQVEVPTLWINFPTTRSTTRGYGVFRKLAFHGIGKSIYRVCFPKLHVHTKRFSDSLAGNTIFEAGVSSADIRLMNYRSLPPYRLVFGVQNFLFDGLRTHYHRRMRMFGLDTFSVNAGGYEYTFIQDPRIKKIKIALDRTGQSRITSWLEVKIDRQREIEDHVERVQDICCMLSIAVGQHVDWLFWRLYDKRGRLVSEHYTDRYAASIAKSGVAFIDNSQIQAGLVKYINSCFDEFVRRKESHQFHRFRHLFIDSYRQHSIDGSLLYLIPLTELIASKILLHSSEKKVAVDVHKLENMNVGDKLRRIYKSYPFLPKRMFDDIVRDFANLIRNPLFHTGIIHERPLRSFSKGIFLRMIALKLFLREIGYTGEFIDPTNNFRVKKFK